MKLKCNDGIVRDFKISKVDVWAGSGEAYCKNCMKKFGVHDTKLLKPKFKAHICK